MLLLWTAGPLVTFLLVQRVKWVAPRYLRRRLDDHEVGGVAFVVSVILTWSVGSVFAPALPHNHLAVHSALIALLLPWLVKAWMNWAKAKKPDLWRALRADRRQHPRQSSRHPSSQDDTTLPL